MTVIATARLILRPARSEDCADLHAILRDPVAMRYWSTLPHGSIEETRDWLDRMMAIEPDTGEDFVIEHEGRVIGKAGFHRFPEIGYALHREYWGKGYAREALTALIDRAFGILGIAAISADVDPRNAASIGLLERLGFVETGRASATWLIGEQWCDSVFLSLAAEAWSTIRPQ